MTKANTPSSTSFGDKLRALLEEKGLTQSAFAKSVGMERSELNRTINGKRQPKPHEIEWFAEALGMSVDELVEGVELPGPLVRSREELQKLVQRVFAAEAEMDKARAEREAAEQALRLEREAWQKERAALNRGAMLAREEHARELTEVRHAAAKEEARLRSQLDAQGNQLAQAQDELDKERQKAAALAQAKTTLEARIQLLTLELAKSRSQKVTAAALTGLAALFVGGALGNASGSVDDDEVV